MEPAAGLSSVAEISWTPLSSSPPLWPGQSSSPDSRMSAPRPPPALHQVGWARLPQACPGRTSPATRGARDHLFPQPWAGLWGPCVEPDAWAPPHSPGQAALLIHTLSLPFLPGEILPSLRTQRQSPVPPPAPPILLESEDQGSELHGAPKNLCLIEKRVAPGKLDLHGSSFCQWRGTLPTHPLPAPRN